MSCVPARGRGWLLALATGATLYTPHAGWLKHETGSFTRRRRIADHVGAVAPWCARITGAAVVALREPRRGFAIGERPRRRRSHRRRVRQRAGSSSSAVRTSSAQSRPPEAKRARLPRRRSRADDRSCRALRRAGARRPAGEPGRAVARGLFRRVRAITSAAGGLLFSGYVSAPRAAADRFTSAG